MCHVNIALRNPSEGGCRLADGRTSENISFPSTTAIAAPGMFHSDSMSFANCVKLSVKGLALLALPFVAAGICLARGTWNLKRKLSLNALKRSYD